MRACMPEYFAEKYSVLAKEKAGEELDTQTRFSIRLYWQGTLGITREWFLNDNITLAEMMPAGTAEGLLFRSYRVK